MGIALNVLLLPFEQRMSLNPSRIYMSRLPLGSERGEHQGYDAHLMQNISLSYNTNKCQSLERSRCRGEWDRRIFDYIFIKTLQYPTEASA